MSINDTIAQQAETLVVETMEEKEPELDLRKGTPQHNLLVAPHIPVVSKIVEQNNLADHKRTTTDWSTLDIEEADSRAALLFTERNHGSYSKGPVRLKFRSPQAVNLTTASEVTQDDLIYHPIADVALEPEDLTRDATLGFYYADLQIVADQVGSKYDAIAGATFEVGELTGTPDFIEAIATGPIQNGLDDETNPELFERSRKGQFTRNLINSPSVHAVLRDPKAFGGVIRDLLVVGMQEPEMKRDLKRIIDAELGPISLHLGNHSDIYVQTPITRKAIEIVVPASENVIDLSAYRALLKIHSVSIKDQPDVTVFYSLLKQDVKTRYSAIDPVELFVDPAAQERTLILDVSYAPDVVTINDFVNGPEYRLSLANVLVRSFVPVWLYANIYVDGGVGKTNEAGRLIGQYVQGLKGESGIVLSRVTDKIHEADIALVHQDFELSAQLYFPDGELLEWDADTVLSIPDRLDKGVTARICRFIAEGVLITPLS